MSRHEVLNRLRDVVDFARLAIAAARGRTRLDMHRDRDFAAACERYIEIVGEAAAHVSVEARGQLPFIPWHEVVGTRNILAHGYSVIDYDVVWGVIVEDPPAIITMIEGLIGPVPKA
jgi:uncharacterized protein with HEPN domain